jgi:serine/threonine-protein kinase
MGSAHYFSPEQARGRHTDERSDIYSLGIVMYEMLTGVPPFNGESPVAIAMMHLQNTPRSPKDINVAIPLSIEHIVMKAIKKEASARYQAAGDMLLDLEMARMGKAIPSESEEYQQTIKIPAVTAGINPPQEDYENPLETPPEAYEPKSKKVRREQEARRSAAKSGASKSDRDKKLKLAVYIAGGFLALAFIFMIIYSFNPGLFSPKSAEVPTLIGKDINEVMLEYKGTKIEIVEDIGGRVESADYAAGIIVDQSPKGGKSQTVPFTVTVTVSAGIQEGFIPNLVGQTEEDAADALKKLGINVKITPDSSATVPEGVVISASPAAGAKYKAGDTVTLTVSIGKNGAEINMPNIIGMTESEAKAELAKNKLEVGTISQKESNLAAGTVISQEPSAGGKINEFSKVDFTVSTGAQATPTPAATGTPKPRFNM